MAKVVRFHELGGPEVMQIEDVTVGEPGAGEVRIRVEAFGLNRAEAMYRQGKYVDRPEFPSLMGYEAAGVVEALGEGVAEVRVGDRVSVLPVFSMALYGVYGQAAVVPASSLAPIPDGVSFEAAAAVWMALITAYGAVVQDGAARKGDTVLITAGSSSVALAALQIARREGMTAILTTRGPSKVAALRAAGADHVIVTSDQDLPAEVARITGGRGASLIFDPVGGSFATTLAKAVSADGRILVYGGLSGEPTPYPLFPPAPGGVPLADGGTIRFYTLREVTEDPTTFAAAKAYIAQGLASGAFTPNIDRTFTLPEVVDAHRYLESNAQVGKIVVRVDH